MLGQTRPYWSALRIPLQGSGLAGGMKRLGPAVEAPKGTPLKMCTPFRRKPRIFPAVVSATVWSEAITLLFPQPVAANAMGEASLRCVSALRDKMEEPANPAPAVATLQRNERRSLE